MAASRQESSTTFGATLVSQPPSLRPDLRPPTTISASPNLSPVPSHESDGKSSLDLPAKSLPITSPFYEHPAASFERIRSRQDSKTAFHLREDDLESGTGTPLAIVEDNPFSSKINVDCNKECKMWPSKQTLIQTRMADKKKSRERRVCACGPARHAWSQLSKSQRLACKIALALIVVGLIVGISVGVTKAVNGSVYGSNGNSHPVGTSR